LFLCHIESRTSLYHFPVARKAGSSQVPCLSHCTSKLVLDWIFIHNRGYRGFKRASNIAAALSRNGRFTQPPLAASDELEAIAQRQESLLATVKRGECGEQFAHPATTGSASLCTHITLAIDAGVGERFRTELFCDLRQRLQLWPEGIIHSHFRNNNPTRRCGYFFFSLLIPSRALTSTTSPSHHPLPPPPTPPFVGAAHLPRLFLNVGVSLYFSRAFPATSDLGCGPRLFFTSAPPAAALSCKSLSLFPILPSTYSLYHGRCSYVCVTPLLLPRYVVLALLILMHQLQTSLDSSPKRDPSST
jgi:hypothetical protein